MEVWKPLTGYEDRYEVSDAGHVRSIERVSYRPNRWGGVETYPVQSRILKTQKVAVRRGYYHRVMLNGASGQKYAYLHRVVAQAFLPAIEGKDEVNHKDGNRCNNCASNLEWVTRIENVRHAIDVLGKKPKAGRSVLVGRTVYPSLVAAAAAIGVSMSHLWKVANGIKKTAKGMKVSYV